MLLIILDICSRAERCTDITSSILCPLFRYHLRVRIDERLSASHKTIAHIFLRFLGRVIDGFEVLDALEKVPVDEKHRPTREILLKGVTVHANPIAQERMYS